MQTENLVFTSSEPTIKYSNCRNEKVGSSIFIWCYIILSMVCAFTSYHYLTVRSATSFREKVRTTNITTSKTKKISENSVDNQNIEKIYISDQNVESQKDQNVENVFWVDHYYDITTTTKKDFRRCDFTYGVKKDQNVENKNINYLWRITYGYQGLWGVRLGAISLG